MQVDRDLSEIAHEIDRRLREAHGDIYAGVALGNSWTSFEVFLTEPESETARALVQNVTQGVHVRFIAALNSLDSLERVFARVQVEWPEIKALGVALWGCGIDVTLNRVVLGVDGLTGAQAELLTSRLGPSQIYVRPGRPPIAASGGPDRRGRSARET